MGERRQRFTRFKAAHPFCCFCGGQATTETIDHLPPKILFVGSQIPADYNLEFPACFACNQGSRQHDQVASLLSMTSPIEMTPALRDHFNKVVGGVSRNANSIIHEINAGFAGQRSRAREFYETTGLPVFATRLGDHSLGSIKILTAKLGLAYYYRESGNILPRQGAVYADIYTNAQIHENRIPEAYKWGSPFRDISNSLTFTGQFLYRFHHRR
jgi:hypothetical protein